MAVAELTATAAESDPASQNVPADNLEEAKKQWGPLGPEEALGYERPSPPDGREHIDGLDLDAALETAGTNPAAGRVVQLIDLMLKDEEFNWSAAYAALETPRP